MKTKIFLGLGVRVGGSKLTTSGVIHTEVSKCSHHKEKWSVRKEGGNDTYFTLYYHYTINVLHLHEKFVLLFCGERKTEVTMYLLPVFVFVLWWREAKAVFLY